MKTSTTTHERATSMSAGLEGVGTPANRLTWAADAATVAGEHRPSPARSLRTATLAFASAVVLVGCSGAGSGTGTPTAPAGDRSVAAAQSSSAAPASPASPADGNYTMSISWPKEKLTSTVARCVVGRAGAAPLTVYELTLANGTVHLRVRVGGPRAPLEDALTGTYRVEKDRIIVGGTAGDLFSATFRATNRDLTLSDMKGGDCEARAIGTTKPWARR